MGFNTVLCYIYLLQYIIIISAYVEIFQCPMELDLVQQQKQMNLCKYISNRVAASMYIGESSYQLSHWS